MRNELEASLDCCGVACCVEHHVEAITPGQLLQLPSDLRRSFNSALESKRITRKRQALVARMSEGYVQSGKAGEDRGPQPDWADPGNECPAL